MSPFPITGTDTFSFNFLSYPSQNDQNNLVTSSRMQRHHLDLILA